MSDADFRIRIAEEGGAATAASTDAVAQSFARAREQSAQLQAGQAAGAAAAESLAHGMEDAAQVAATYGVSLATAQRALAILGAEAGHAMQDLTALDGAMDQAQLEAEAAAVAQGAYSEQLARSAAAAIQAGEAQTAQVEISSALAGALTRLGIAQAEVAATATRMGISEEIAGRAMVQMKQAEMAAAVTEARIAMEGLTLANVEGAAAQETVNVAADAGAMKFGRGSPFFHAMVSAVNMSRGGTMALRGFFEAIELASFALPGFIGPLLLAGATLYEVTEHLEKHNGRLKEGTDELGKTASAWSVAGNQVKGYKAALELLLTTQKQQLEVDDHLLQNAKDRAGLEKTDAKQDQEKRLQSLRGQYLEDQAGATTDDQRKQIKARYEAAKKDIEEGGVVNTALLDAVEAQQQVTLTQKKLADAQAAHAADTQTAAEAFNKAQQARSRLDPHGIGLSTDGKTLSQVDPDTGKVGYPIDEKEKEIQKGEQAVLHTQNLPEIPLGGGVASDAERERQRRVTEQRQAKLEQDRKDRDQLQSDLAALQEEKTTTATLGPKLDPQQDEIRKLQDQVDQLNAESVQKSDAVDLAVTNKKQEDKQAGLDAALEKKREQDRIARETRDNELEARINNVEAQLKNADPAAKITYENMLAKLRDQQVQNKASDELSETTDPALSKSIRDKAGSQVAQSDATGKAAATRVQKQESASELAALKKQVADLEKKLAARPDHPSLEPYEKSILALSDPVAEIPQLQGLLAQQMGAFVTKMQDKTNRLQSDVSSARQDISDLQRKVKNNSNHG